MIDVRDECFLHEQYVEQKKSIMRIANEFNSTYKKIRYWLIKGNIPIRSCSEAGQEIHQSENHGMWKGNEAGYAAIHYWVQRYKPKPEVCGICGKSGVLELSNKTGKLIRDIDNFQYIHKSCHKKYDKENEIKHQFSIPKQTSN